MFNLSKTQATTTLRFNTVILQSKASGIKSVTLATFSDALVEVLLIAKIETTFNSSNKLILEGGRLFLKEKVNNRENEDFFPVSCSRVNSSSK